MALGILFLNGSTNIGLNLKQLAIKKRKLCKVTNHLSQSDDTSVNWSSIPEHRIIYNILRWTVSEEYFEHVTCHLYGKTAVEIFEEFFSPDIADHIVQQSMLYAQQKNNPNFYLTADELRSFGHPIWWTRTLGCTNNKRLNADVLYVVIM